MVDTNVVIYAMRRPKPSDPQDLKDMLAASDALIRALPSIRVSALTVVEIQRGLRPNERSLESVRALFSRFQVEPADGAAADLAVKLLQQRNANESVCPRCLGTANDHKCARCGRVASSQQRINDALIAATADTRITPAVPVLYAFDTGVLAFKPYVSQCRIEQPPNAYGPLFEKKPG
jgi:predicted nucleic acid-binding protein